MTVGWDFFYLDGIRDRNTGIWRDISVFTTGRVRLEHPFVKSELSRPNYDVARQTVSVEVSYPDYVPQNTWRKAKGERRNPGRGHPLREGGETLPRRGEAGRLHPRGVPAARDPQPAPVVAAEQGEAGTVRPDAEGRIRRQGERLDLDALRHPGDHLHDRHAGQIAHVQRQRPAALHPRHQLAAGGHAPHVGRTHAGRTALYRPSRA